MKQTKHIVLLLLLVFLASVGNAQEDIKPNHLLAKNQQDGTVFLKWVCAKVYYEEGFNVYRKTNSGNWEKLNPTPLLWNDKAIGEVAKAFPDVSMFVGVFSKISIEEFQGNVASVFALQKAMQNNDFALAMAIGFIDQNTILGTTYTYKVTALENGIEIDIDQLTFTVEDYQPVSPPQQIKLERKKRKINFNFTPEPLRYFGIRIEKTSSDGTFDVLTGKETYPIQKDHSENGKLEPWPKFLYVDQKINKDLNYTYEFFAIDYFGETSASSGEIKSDAIDFDPPFEAFGLNGKVDTMRITLSWIMVDDEDRVGINVYRYTDLDEDSIKLNKLELNKETESFTDQVPQFGTYFYKVGVYDLAGNEILSSPTMVQAKDVLPPLPPIGLKTSTDTGKVNLVWKKNSEPDLKGYVIFKVIDDGKNNNSEYTMVNAKPITETIYTENMSKNVKNTFHYVVVAVDTSWNYSEKSELSIAGMPDYVAPVQPFIKMVSENENKITVEWVLNKDEDLLGYKLYRLVKKDTAQKTEELNRKPINASSAIYEDNLYVPGITYTYFLTALDSSGNESEKSAGFEIHTSGNSKDKEVKLKSFAIKKKRKGKLISIKWIATPIAEIEGFIIYRKESNSNRFEPYTGQLQETIYIDRAVKEGKTYNYQLRVYTKSGGIIRSEVKKVEIPQKK